MKSRSFFIALLTVLFCSCKNRELNYITYYNKVNDIDSIFRIANKPKKAIHKYRKLFRKYPPKNQERIAEYETYITLADRYKKNFGGKENLYKLIHLNTPYNNYKRLYGLYQKYGIDSTH